MLSDNPLYATAIPIYPLKSEATKGSKTRSSTDINFSGGASSAVLKESQLEQLMQQGFTRGLAESMNKNNQVFPFRFWVIDNSGSMQKADGHRIVDTLDTDVKIVPGTRWEEIRETVNYHIRAASLLKAPTCFRLLNNPGSRVGPQIFSVADNNGLPPHEAIKILRNTNPSGGTPLRQHIEDIYAQISVIAPELVKTGSRAVIVIATDGLPTDETAQGGAYQQQLFVDALRSLEGLPVWLVIRLCTDDDAVVEFYNNLDEQLELSMDVLDDFCGEALEIHEFNPWLNYALPLHRCREMGFFHRIFDLIDERKLTKSEVREYLQLLLGDLDGVPDPSIDWLGFCNEIEGLLRKQKLQWNPVTKKMAPW
eukprot:CAMPEP_0119008938 /NCGR_PEP_ID=MMETSP1176-20130426/4027_1 /TAXON_ID=265551 /ORGANISM="Synedropsis recta cf, Strain CCMP1620" /LENGTH=366 /DNA_ID=CAMNT_0006961359 /DNA_START=82 /DNA_END=1179 /DNA_ORIENTATION=+